MLSATRFIVASSIAIPLALPAAAVTIVDGFEYADQAALEAVYAVDLTGATSSITLDAANDNVDLLAEAPQGSTKLVRMTYEASDFKLTSDSGASVGVTTLPPFEFFGRLYVGLSAADDSSESIALRIQPTSGSNIELRLLTDTLTTVNVSASSNGAVFTLEIGETTATVLLNGSEVAGLTNIVHNLDYSKYSTGAEPYLELESVGGSTINRTVTVDNFTIEADLIPEPSSMGLLTAGAVAMVFRRRHR